MVKKNRYFTSYRIFISCFVLSGCVSVEITPSDLAKHQTVQSVFSERFSESWLAKDQSDLAKPLMLARNYCAQQGGSLYRTGEVEQAYYLSSLIQRPSPIAPLQAKLTGEFVCNPGGDKRWRIDIALLNKACDDCFNRMRFTFLDAQQLTLAQAKRAEAKAAEEKRLQKMKEGIFAAAEEGRKRKELERQNAMATIPNNNNIGRKICKFGQFQLNYPKGYSSNGTPQYDTTLEPGNLIATLESHSLDKVRIQFRIIGWSPVMPLARNASYLSARLGDYAVQPGVLYWDDVYEWRLC